MYIYIYICAERERERESSSKQPEGLQGYSKEAQMDLKSYQRDPTAPQRKPEGPTQIEHVYMHIYYI